MEDVHIIEHSIYALKSRFQKSLKPLLKPLIRRGLSPNQVTVFTCLLCVAYASLLAWSLYTSLLLLCFPLLMFVRMALNALDGMLATETNNKTPLGSVLNEVCDLLSDVALFSAFLYLISVNQFQVLWWLLTLMVVLSEFVSLAVFQAINIRSHSGPFGKSDRAVYLGLLAILLWVFPSLLSDVTLGLILYILLGIALAGLTIWNRFKSLDDLSE